jgi:LPS-assembly lipoprotein
VGKISRVFGALALTAATLGVGGCGFQPLHGTTASGANLDDVLKTVDIATIPGRTGQQVRNELIFGVTGGGESGPRVYRLEIAVKQSIANTFATTSGNVQGQTFELSAEFKLVRIADNQVVFKSSTGAHAAYDKVQSIFADVRAQRDAENRTARTVAEAIKTQVAGYLSGHA